MIRCQLTIMACVLLLGACGNSPAEEANPFSVVPENPMVVVFLNDPAAMVRNIDVYIEEGAPMLGANLLENLICEQLDVISFDEISLRYGFDLSGQVAYWMESAVPQSMAMVVSAPDFSLFVSLLPEMGVELADEEPINSAAVYSLNSDAGKMYIAGVQGVALMAMSKAKLETLINGLSAEGSVHIEDASLTMNINLSMIGPMVVQQMPMARMMMMQGMEADTTMPAFVPAMLDVYMDGLEAFLTDADKLEFALVTGPEDFIIRKNMSFIPGSDLAEMLVSSPSRDMLQSITQGDLATVRFQMPSELAQEITAAFSEVFTGSEVDDSFLQFWGSTVSNGAVSVFNGDFVHMAAAYEVSDDVTIQDVAVMYSEYMEVITPLFQQNAELASAFSIQDNGIVSVEGTDFYSMSMSIVPDSTAGFTFDYWMTVHDGALLVETASEPTVLLSIVSGEYVPAVLEDTGEMAGELSLAGYLSMIMTMSQNGMDIPETGSDVIITWDGAYSDGTVTGELTMDGSDAVSTGFAFFGIMAATL